MTRLRPTWPAAVALVALLAGGCSEDMLDTEADNGGPSEYSAEQWEDYSCGTFTQNDLGTQHKDVEGLVEHLGLDVAEEDMSALEADLVLRCNERPGDTIVESLEAVVAEG